MKIALIVVCIVAASSFAVLPVHSTLVVFQWTPDRILFSADSLSAKVRTNQITGVIECKIHQEGDIFFTIVGINDDQTLKIDLVSIAMQAARAKGTIENKITAFDKLGIKPASRLLRDSITRSLTGPDFAMRRISVLFFSRIDHAIAVKEYIRDENENVRGDPHMIYGVGLGRVKKTDYVAVGVSAEAQAAVLKKIPTLSGKTGIPFIVGFIEAQRAHERDRRRLHQIPRVGGPISVLEISNRQAAWVTNHQKPCPEVKK